MEPDSEDDDGRLRSFESDIEDFGSTVSLASTYSVSNSFTDGHKDKIGVHISTPRSRLDPQVYRKHRERNISLRYNLAEKLLKPVIVNSIKKIDKLSQNISNYQVNMQDALFQSRITTSNLIQLQKQLEAFAEANYLKELKIQDDDAKEIDTIEIDVASEHSNVTSTVPL